MEELDLEIGLKLRKMREDLKLSTREVARRIGVDHSYISKIEGGKMPSLEKLKKLCGLYGISIQSLFGEEVEVPNEMRELGVEWIAFAKDMKEKKLSPDEIVKMVDVIKALKNL